MPRSTDPEINGIVETIRRLCDQPFTPEAEADLRRLARELRVAIRNHLRMATSSLGTKKTAIDERDPEGEARET